MKYGPSLQLAEWLGSRLATYLEELQLPADWTHIVPLVGTPGRLTVRGFDQAEVIARTLCCALHFERTRLRADLLTRRPNAKAQADTAHQFRFKNSDRSLVLRRRPCPGARILLIDDVTTTGATALRAAILLRNAGASKIDMLSVVRASAWEEYRMRRVELTPKHLCRRPEDRAALPGTVVSAVRGQTALPEGALSGCPVLGSPLREYLP